MNHILELQKKQRRSRIFIYLMALAVALTAILCLFAGSSNMTLREALNALLGSGSAAHSRIIWKIRVPRVLAALIAGA